MTKPLAASRSASNRTFLRSTRSVRELFKTLQYYRPLDERERVLCAGFAAAIAKRSRSSSMPGNQPPAEPFPLAELLHALKWHNFGLDERETRLCIGFAAAMAGPGGVAAAAAVTGIARSTILRGIADIVNPERLDSGRQRRPGGGRKRKCALISS